jgi:hypothetical protein
MPAKLKHLVTGSAVPAETGRVPSLHDFTNARGACITNTCRLANVLLLLVPWPSVPVQAYLARDLLTAALTLSLSPATAVPLLRVAETARLPGLAAEAQALILERPREVVAANPEAWAALGAEQLGSLLVNDRLQVSMNG